MASACALAMNSGRITYISRLSRSAERSKRYFHGKGRRGKQVALPATPLFPKETGVADAVSIYDPSGENGFQESPQTFLNPEIINNDSARFALFLDASCFGAELAAAVVLPVQAVLLRKLQAAQVAVVLFEVRGQMLYPELCL